jgi:hypothetical protein
LGLYQLNDTDIPSNSSPGLYRYEDINGDGSITAGADRKIIGYRDPAYRFGIKNTFYYKNFSLMIFLNSIQGGKDYYYAAMQGPYGGAIDDNVRRDNRGVEHMKYWWTPQNPNAPFKELFMYDPIGNDRYFQRNFIRLQDVSLSYRVDPSFTKKLKIEALNVYVSGKNLYTWTKWYGLDPEYEKAVDNIWGLGFTYSYPVLKNWTFGINISF